MRSAPGFQLRIVPSSVLPMIASSDESTIAARWSADQADERSVRTSEVTRGGYPSRGLCTVAQLRSRSVPTLLQFRQRRLHDCRLTPDRALQTLDEAEAFLADRGVLTLTPDSMLPSLFGACHEEPYKKGSRGFGSWPKTKYVWAFQLSERPGVLALQVPRGKGLLCHREATRAIDPLARAAPAEAEAAGDDRARLQRPLGAAGRTPPGAV